jgi:amidase
MTMGESELVCMTAADLVRRIHCREVSAREVMTAHLAQIRRVNPRVNAIVSQIPEEKALAAADDADARLAGGDEVGPLHGLPIAFKDLVLTKGIPTTYGSPIFKDFIPNQDDLIVERLRQAGAICIGKTNTPEFGAGSQTYNEVFGETLNPYDLTKTCGGSSGGAAVALACRMLPIADGSDLGGSLRNPAGFCNVVGFRVSPGRVPQWPSRASWSPGAVQGPMARTVEDAALLLRAMAGPDPRDPKSVTEPGHIFSQPLERDFNGVRVAWSRDLGGLPVDARVTAVLDAQRQAFESLGCVVEEAEPDLRDCDRVFKIWRGWARLVASGELLKLHRAMLKETVIYDLEQGAKLTGADLAWAEVKRTEIFHRMRVFLEEYDFFICPVSQVPPFDIKQRYVEEINGERMETYIDWMKSCCHISVTSHPAISVPAGFTREGLPVGLQIVGGYRDDFGVLQLAHAFEKATAYGKRLPPVVE